MLHESVGPLYHWVDHIGPLIPGVEIQLLIQRVVECLPIGLCHLAGNAIVITDGHQPLHISHAGGVGGWLQHGNIPRIHK